MATEHGDAADLPALVRRLSDGVQSVEELARATLDRIDALEPGIGAFHYLDPAHVIRQAQALDARRASGQACGPLFGIPVAIKDIFDTRDMPTEDGTALHAGRRPVSDCRAVAHLRAAGALIVGKTVTTELAYFGPGKTRNPVDPARTPGGSSSGSAAAVAAGMVPLALGSQTNGSMLRPASFCGVTGFKPSHGLISRHGVLTLSRTLDHVGVFGSDLAGIALAIDVLAGADPHDPDTRETGWPRLLDTMNSEPPMPPRFGFVRPPWWDRAEMPMREGLEELALALGTQCDEMELPQIARHVPDWIAAIMAAEMAHNLRREHDAGQDRLSQPMWALLERGRQLPARDYLSAVAGAAALREQLAPLFEEVDALLLPAAPGPAPHGLDATGDPVFNSMASLSGLPAISLPLLTSDEGLPMGVQLIGRFGDDARLLRTARSLIQSIRAIPETQG